MPHKTSYNQISPGISRSERSLLKSDSLRQRRTSASLKSISPGSRRRLYDSISIQDLMGGEKNATDINSPGSLRRILKSPTVTPKSLEGSPTVVNAEDKIHGILQARELRQRRRSDICKSLDNASPMIEKSARKSFSGLPQDLQNITLPLNDVTDSSEGFEKGGRRRRRSSIGSGRRSDVSREHRMRMQKGLDEQNVPEKKNSLLTPFSPKSPSGMKRVASANSLKDRLRQRLQGANYCDLNGSSHSDSETEEWTMRVKGSASYSDDECTADMSDDFLETSTKKAVKRRSKSGQRSRSKSSKRLSKKGSEGGEKDESGKKSRSKSKSRTRSKSKSNVKRRSSVGKVESAEIEDDANISTSFTRGSRRRSTKSLVEDPVLVSDGCSDLDCSQNTRSSRSTGSPRSSSRKGRRRLSQNVLDTSNSSTESCNISPGSLKGKKRTKTKRPSIEKSGNEDPSLGGFLTESERLKVRGTENDNLSHVTEEKSIGSAEPPPQFLQFDPTSGSNHVRSVDQNQAKKTKEVINGLHGDSKLEIAEPNGLPTFEKLDTSVGTGATEELSSNSSSNHDPNDLFSTIQFSPKKGMFPRSASMVSPAPPAVIARENFFEDCGQNAQWNVSALVSPRANRKTIGNAGKNMLFGKKGERLDKPMRRSSDLGARTNSLGSMMGLRARYKARGYDDGELLLKI